MRNNQKVSARILILTIFILISALSVLGLESDFSVVINPIDDDIYEDEAGIYELIITNNASFDEYLERPTTYQVDWITYTEPGLIHIPAGKTRIFNLTLDPKNTVIPAQHEVLISFTSSITKNNVDKNAFIYIRPLNQAFPGYKASIALSVDIPYEIDPRNEVPMTLYLRNRNALNIENMTVSMTSDVINKDLNFPFLPLEEKTQQFRFNIDNYQEPIETVLNVKLIIKNFTVNQINIPIKIVPYTELVGDKDVKKSFLKTTTYVQVKNEGNILNKEPYLVPVTFFQGLFTSTYPKSESLKIEDQRYKGVYLNLAPNTIETVEVETNYRIILYTILIVSLSIFAYYKFRSPIILKKRVMPIHIESEGANEFHIRLLVMNRTKQPVENVSVTEIIPKIVSVIREHSIGTLEPTKVITHEKKGTLMKWDINYLEPYEERIITFKIVSKLGIVGNLILPKTKAKYEQSNGMHRVTYSSKETLKI